MAWLSSVTTGRLLGPITTGRKVPVIPTATGRAAQRAVDSSKVSTSSATFPRRWDCATATYTGHENGFVGSGWSWASMITVISASPLSFTTTSARYSGAEDWERSAGRSSPSTLAAVGSRRAASSSSAARWGRAWNSSQRVWCRMDGIKVSCEVSTPCG